MGSKYNTHRFFCIKCGNEGIPILRPRGFRHAAGHYKKLYCPHCQMEMNHVECLDDFDVYDFRMNFEEGAYLDEVEKSLAHLGVSGVGEINLGEETDI